jgi:molybdopterin molybdotransferase
MISVEQAHSIITSCPIKIQVEKRALKDCLGVVLAEEVLSPIDMPPFNQSAMDGFALHFVEGNMDYKIIGEMAAGEFKNCHLKPGEGIRIFTGAYVPETANLIVQQEWVSMQDEQITILQKPHLNDHIRPKGEQIQTGELALHSGTKLNAASIGFLAGLGITEVTVYAAPKIGLVTTGNELVQPGNELPLGKIYESNAVMLLAALKTFGFSSVQVETVEDDYEATKNSIEKGLKAMDLLILTGGISVGSYDFVSRALSDLGVGELFYKINQKPGKPIYFGRFNETYVLALPGNPAAALTCFYMYVLPLLNRMAGDGNTTLPLQRLPLKTAFRNKGGRAVFLKARLLNGTLEILEGQSSAMLRSFAIASHLAYLPADKEFAEQGELVSAYQLA